MGLKVVILAVLAWQSSVCKGQEQQPTKAHLKVITADFVKTVERQIGLRTPPEKIKEPLYHTVEPDACEGWGIIGVRYKFVEFTDQELQATYEKLMNFGDTEGFSKVYLYKGKKVFEQYSGPSEKVMYTEDIEALLCPGVVSV
jgi:hypothetical protein